MKILYMASVGDYSAKDAGYGNSSVGIFKVLNELKIDGSIDELRVIDLSNKISFDTTEEFDIGIISAHPNSFKNPEINHVLRTCLNTCKKKYLSILWETDPLPEDWKWLWETDYFTGFLAPSDFIYDLLKSATVNTTKKIYKYTYLFEPQKFKKVNIDFKLKEEIFTVLYLGQYTKRKGIEETIISFVKSLGKNVDCQLILKYFLLGEAEFPIEKYIEYQVTTNIALKDFKAGIFTIEENLQFEKLNNLYQGVSLLLAPSRGEGFGLTPIEAMCVGIPVIYTDWSGFTETAMAPGNIPIGYDLDYSINMAHHGYEYNSYYAYPHLNDLVRALQFKYSYWKDNRKKYYEEVSENYKIVEEKFGMETCKKYLLNVIRGNYNE